MAKTKLIVIWGGEDILNSSIELFLASKEYWDVVRITDTEDLDALIQEVQSTRPDVVIIHKGDCPQTSFLPLELLLRHPRVKVITISVDSNTLEVFSKRQMTVEQASDLIAVIENEQNI